MNDVRVADEAGAVHPAQPQASVSEGARLLTGEGARAELLFSKAAIARLGAETSVRIRSRHREFELERGTLLVALPPFQGGARIHTGSVLTSFGGATVLIEHLPQKSVKLVVLAGDARVAVDRFLGDSLVLTPGKMLILPPALERIPDPVDVDLATLVRTSSLINAAAFRGGMPAAMPSLREIEKETGRQAKLLKAKGLFPTNLVIAGSGTNVTIPGSDPRGTAGERGPGQMAPASTQRTLVTRDERLATRQAHAMAQGTPLPLP